MATAVNTHEHRHGSTKGRDHLAWSSIALTAAIWLSAALFGAYIVLYYAGAILAGVPEQWNAILPGLYEASTPTATAGIAAHFAAGGVILLLGPIQLLGFVRRKLPAFHRWLGRIYIAAAAVAGAGGLAFIAFHGTIGGAVMDVGFGLYGALTLSAAFLAYLHARARNLGQHRAWAIRLFALAIGSWLYRMYYGFWFMLTGGAGHTRDFSGWFDVLMAFFFYVPNLVLAEIIIRARSLPPNRPFKMAAAILVAGAALLVLLATYWFTVSLWWPGIATRLGLIPFPF